MTRSSHAKWFSWAPLLLIAVIAASPLIGEAQTASSTCPGIPLLCGMTCSLDAFGTPIYCSNGTCTCASGYDTRSGPSGLVCLPTQPEVIGTEARDSGVLGGGKKYDCPGYCSSDADNRVGGAVPWSPVGNGCQGGSQGGSTCLSNADCAGTCGPKTHGQCEGGTRDGLPCKDQSDCPGTVAQCVAMGFCSGHGGLCESDADCAGQCVPVTHKPFDLVPVHGIAPGGEAFMPVWGQQANQCGDHGLSARCSGGSQDGDSCNTSADCPGGTCTPVGICRGGSNGNGTCFGSADCAGTCGPKTHGQCQGGTRDGLPCKDQSDCPGTAAQCVAMGFCSGHGALCESDADCTGQCVPVGRCSTDGRTCSGDADCPRGGTCNAVRTWAGCAPDPFPFCFGLQDSDEGDFDFPSCHSGEGCGSCGDVDCGDWKPSRSAPPGSQDACSECGHCVHSFTDAWPYIDNTATCSAGATIGVNGGVSDPARIDFPNNGIVYRAPTRWESFCDSRFGCAIDQDFTWDMESPGRELHDTDDQFAYHQGCADETHGRVHIEYNAFESVSHFAANDWGAANQWWRAFADVVRTNVFGGEQGDNNVRCFVKSFVNPGLTCPPSEDVDADCSLHDAIAVVAGIPSIDCADDAYQGTDEIHPVLGMALRIQEDPTLGSCQGGSNGGGTCRTGPDCAGTCGPKTEGQCQGGTRDGLPCKDQSDCPGTAAQCVAMGFCSGHGGLCESDADCAGQCRVGQQWAFFYRQTGNTGPCGSSSYSRCLSTFKLPLGLPEVPGNAVVTGADVHLDWHAWRMDDSVPTDVNVDSTFDLTNGTILNVTLPHFDEGVVGLVTVTPALDATPPQLTCPAPIVVDATGPSGAVVSYAPSVSDNCSVASLACTPPSGTTFTVGDSTAGCTASDVANNTTSCSLTIHVKGPAEQIGDLITMVNGLATKSGIRKSLLAKLTAALARQQGENPAAACGPLHAFIKEVNAQRGKSISASDADALVTAARQIMVVNGCRP
jgi:HYR domain